MVVRWLAFLLCSAAALGAARAEPSRPNLLLIVAEDLSPRLGAFGDPVAVTPALDRLARQGTRYPNAFTTSGVCAPSRAALLTGVHQIAIGAHHMRTNDLGYRTVPPPEVKAFPELLRRGGYWTYTGSKLDYQFSGPFWGSGPFTIWDAEGVSVHWRDRPEGMPFFGMVNLAVTHESALFPRPALPRSFLHLATQLLYLYQFRGHRDVVAPSDVAVPPYYPDTPAVRRDLARHYNHIHRMDETVAELLAELEEDGLSGSTLVIFTSDHGDGLPRAKREIFDSGIHVPLIVRWPDVLRPPHARPGDVDERLVSFVDLAPTILALAGLEIPPRMQGRVFLGPAVPPPRRYVYAARDRTDEFSDRQRAVRDHRFKYIRNYRPGEPGAQRLAFREQQDIMRELWSLHEAGRLEGPTLRWFSPRAAEELYDTRDDPHEVRDLAGDPEYGATLARLRGALDAWLARGPDLGEIPEREMIQRMWPGGTQPRTEAPRIAFESDSAGGVRVSLTSPTEGASIGYRVDGRAAGSDWSLYAAPFVVPPGARLEAKAVRYGWAESEVSEARAPR